MGVIFLYPIRNKMKSREQETLTNWLSKKNYHFYVTKTFTNRLSDETILKKMEYFKNHYLIEELFWVREFTTDGKPHIHMVIKSKKILKSFNKLKKILKDWGNTDFRIFSKSLSTNCLGYLSKEYHNENSLWGIK